MPDKKSDLTEKDRLKHLYNTCILTSDDTYELSNFEKAHGGIIESLKFTPKQTLQLNYDKEISGLLLEHLTNQLKKHKALKYVVVVKSLFHEATDHDDIGEKIYL